jgi:hypothetical protein
VQASPSGTGYKLTSPVILLTGLAKHLIIKPKQLTSLAKQLTVDGDVFASLQGVLTLFFNYRLAKAVRSKMSMY